MAQASQLRDLVVLNGNELQIRVKLKGIFSYRSELVILQVEVFDPRVCIKIFYYGANIEEPKSYKVELPAVLFCDVFLARDDRRLFPVGLLTIILFFIIVFTYFIVAIFAAIFFILRFFLWLLVWRFNFIFLIEFFLLRVGGSCRLILRRLVPFRIVTWSILFFFVLVKIVYPL